MFLYIRSIQIFGKIINYNECMLQSYIGKCVETGGLHQSFKLNSRVRLPVGAQITGLVAEWFYMHTTFNR